MRNSKVDICLYFIFLAGGKDTIKESSGKFFKEVKGFFKNPKIGAKDVTNIEVPSKDLETLKEQYAFYNYACWEES